MKDQRLKRLPAGLAACAAQVSGKALSRTLRVMVLVGRDDGGGGERMHLVAGCLSCLKTFEVMVRSYR